MKRSKFTDAQKAFILKQAEDVCWTDAVRDAAFEAA